MTERHLYSRLSADDQAYPMSHSGIVERERMNRFVRSENVARFRHLLTIERVGAKRKMLLKLLDEELQKQRDAGDAT